jgi:hypothetical protein
MSDDLHSTTHFDPIEEELVAYLDGELDAAAGAAIERRLVEDAVYRQKLIALQQAWDLLDHLPRASVGEKFTQTTVELVAQSAVAEAQQRESQRHVRRWLTRIGSLAVAVIAGVLGFVLVQRISSQANEQLVRDLPVIENVDAYRYADSVKFLEQLETSGLFVTDGSSEVSSQARSPMESLSTVSALLDESLEARRVRLEQMPAETKDALSHRSKRFKEMPPTEQQRLRELHAQLGAHPNAQQLRDVLERYVQWLRTLAAGERAELLSLAQDERLARIKDLKQQQDTQQFRGLIERQLTKDDLEKINAWLDEVVEKHEQALLETIPQERRKFILDEQDEQRRRHRLMFALWSSRGPGGPPSPLPEVVDPEDVQRLAASLSAEAKAALAEAKTPADVRALIQRWVRAAIFMRRTPEVDQETLLAYFEKLPSQPRQWLERMPREQMLHWLGRLYVYSQIHGDDGGFQPWNWGGRDGDGGRRGRGGGPGGPGPEPGGRGRGGPGPSGGPGPGGGSRGEGFSSGGFGPDRGDSESSGAPRGDNRFDPGGFGRAGRGSSGTP